MIRSCLVILVGYVINSSLVANLIDPGRHFVPGVAALTISLGFGFALLGGYLSAIDTQNRHLRVALIISGTFLLGLLLVASSANIERSDFQIARFVAMLTGVGLGAYLKTPETVNQPAYTENKAAPFGPAEEVRFKESNSFIRHIFDNLVRWFTFFVTVNYVSMGWFATSSNTSSSNMLPIISGLFVVQNFLGILMCRRVKIYIASVRLRIMENGELGIGVAFPDGVYLRAVNLMIAALLTILVVWVAFVFRAALPKALWRFT